MINLKKSQRIETYEHELKQRGCIRIGDEDWEVDGIYDYHTEWIDGKEYLTIASTIGLVGEQGYATLTTEPDGHIDSFSYDFDDDGYHGGEDIPYNSDTIVLVWSDYKLEPVEMER